MEVVTGSTTLKYKSPEAEQLRLRTAIATAGVIVLFPLPLFYYLFMRHHVHLVTSILLWASVLSVMLFLYYYTRYRRFDPRFLERLQPALLPSR